MNIRGVLRRFALYAALLTVGVAQPMLQLYGSNLAVFTAADLPGTGVIAFALVTILVPPLALLVIDVLVSWAPGRVRNAVRHALVVVAATPFGMLLVRSVDVPWVPAVGLALVPAGAIAVLHARSGAVRSWLRWTSLLAPVVLALFVVSAQSVVWEPAAAMVSVTATSVAAPGAATGPATEPGDVSVLWLQLDEAPLWPLLGTDGNINAKRFPGFAALAAESTWFRNALGVSQTTVDAVPAMLTGMEPVTGRAPTYSNYRKNLFALMYKRRAFDVHEMATALCPKEACATVSVSGNDEIAVGGGSGVQSTTTTSPVSSTSTVTVDATARKADYGMFLRDALVVLGHKLLPKDLRDGLPAIDEGWGGFGANNNVDIESSELTSPDTSAPKPVPMPTLPSIGGTTLPKKFSDTVVESKKNTVRRWEADGAKSQVPVAEDMIGRAARSGIPTLHFAHVLLPHRPWQLTPDMRTTRFVSTDKRDAKVEDRVRDEYQAFLAQYVATDSIVLKLVTNMKRSANWDRTMIIVTADHGLAFEPGESKRKDINPERTDTLEEIYRVPLFVKFPDQSAPAVSDCGVQGFDLMPMIVNATGLDAGWRFDGTDVTRNCPARPVRTVWWNGGRTTLSSDRTAALVSARRFSKWVDADGGVNDIAKPVGYGDWFGVSIPAGAPRDTTVRKWTNRDTSSFRSTGEGRFASTPLQFDGTVVVGAAITGNPVGLIVMDGRVVAVIPELGSMRAGTNPYRSMVVPSALTPGRHQPLLYVARGVPDAPVISLVGPAG